MNELFGIPMTSIMYVLLAIFALGVLSVAWIGLKNRTMFRMGLRNLPRRGMQTGLVVVGLMLATLITTAAFTTGDTVDYSITKAGYDQLQRTDLSVNFQGEESEQSDRSFYARQDSVEKLEREFTGDPAIAGFVPFLFEPAPLVNARTGLSEPAAEIAGIDVERLTAFGGLRLVGGGNAGLAALTDTEVLLGEEAAEDLGAQVGDMLTVYIADVPTEFRVAGIVRDELASGQRNRGFAEGDTGTLSGAVMRLNVLQRLTGHEGEINFLSVSLKGTVAESYKLTDDAVSRLAPYVESPAGRAALGITTPVEIDEMKADAIADAEATGSLFVTFFLILGLFSIAAGIMLIFMIFVMLAAERKPEMGMARAVGAQRSDLVQSFISEGMAYSLLAGLVGAALGVAAAVGLVVGFLQWSGGEEFEFITAHVTIRSLIVSYCLGVVITFITVAISSLKVSSVNIVSAIRGLEEDGKRERRRSTNWKWVIIGLPSMIVPPLGIWFLFRKGFGLAWAWIIAPIGIVIGGLTIMMASGGGGGSEFFAAFGFSIIPLSLAMLAAHYQAPSRLTWTLVGTYLAAYWLLPFNMAEKVLGTKLEGDIEMFVLSGVMVVIAFTLIIVFNAGLLTTLFQRSNGGRYRVPVIATLATLGLAAGGVALNNSGDGVGQLLYLFAGMAAIVAATSFAAARLPHLAPAIKMGIAYPLSSRFRTGMTLAMFSLIVFSIVTFSAVNANFTAANTGQDGDGGWDVVATANRNNPVDDVPAALQSAGAPIAGQIEATGRVTTFTGTQQLRDPDNKDEWVTYPTVAGDDAFFAEGTKLESRARGYDSDAAVFEAIRSGENFAVVDTTDWGPYSFSFNPDVEDDRFDPFQVEFRDTTTNKVGRVTVIGVLSSKLPATFIAGVYVNESTYTAVYGEPSYLRTFVRTDEAPKTAARAIESALSTQGVQADGIRKLIDDGAAQDRAFSRMFQGFMALGLFVGIAALGVIAFRSVVERRQQIGMLRAIGYQSSTVALTFALESAFIALMGILSGVVGGVIVSRNLFTSGQFASEGVEFTMPWTEVMVFTVIAFGFSLLMTWWPSRNAAKVPVADALRYE